MSQSEIIRLPGKKQCTRCRLVKKLSEFSDHKHTRDRKQSQCKVCTSNRTPEQYEAAMARIKDQEERDARWRQRLAAMGIRRAS